MTLNRPNRITIDKARIALAIFTVLDGVITQDESFELGNPQTREVEAELTEHPGMVWIHGISGQVQELNDGDDKQLVVRALLGRDKIPDGLAVYGLPVKAKKVNGIYEIQGLDGLRAAEFLFGLLDRLQRSVDISQLDYMLARPTKPPSGKIEVSASNPVFSDTAYRLPSKLSSDLIAAYEPALAVGEAVAVKVELDPVTNTLYYEAGAEFVNTSHELAFNLYYPAAIDPTRFLVCWVKIYESMLVIDIADILHGQEFINKGGGSSGDYVYYFNAPIYWRGMRITNG